MQCFTLHPMAHHGYFDDINDKWFVFCSLLQECLDKFLSLKKVTVVKQGNLLHGLVKVSQ